MCWLSVQCVCKHNIAIPHPTKACIRPRNPRGCWIIRRGEPLTNYCPGCEEYHDPLYEQPAWKDVKRCHGDPVIEWSEINHYDIISLDKARHKNCDSERLEFRKHLHWKAMISKEMIAGWSVTDRGAIVSNTLEEESGDESRDEYHEDEVMEAINANEIHKILFDTEDEQEEDFVGYKLERMPSRAQLAESLYRNGNKYDFDSIFQDSETSDGSSSGSDDSNEAVNGSDESANETICYDQDEDGENEPLLKLEEMFDQIEASKPFNPSSTIITTDSLVWAPPPPDFPVGDPVKKPLFQNTPLKLVIKAQPDTAMASEPFPPITAATSEGTATAHNGRINQALTRMRCMQAACFEAINAGEIPERPSTPTPMSTPEGSSGEELEEKDPEGDLLSFQFN
ncbi:uncharacterized protein DFL_003841 [Arthrobotrys flagrans]|uniref:Uncharacterized protein n=1 Tax=Arthrobotrys flagrans TaxID=97331 RepID=A0A437A368_ARTFL|nr:hypothetical protein DFL_003841 [Arthrobotrys flagrans]